MGMLGLIEAIPAPWQNWDGNQCPRGAAPSNLESMLDWDWFSWEIERIQESRAGKAMDKNSSWNSRFSSLFHARDPLRSNSSWWAKCRIPGISVGSGLSHVHPVQGRLCRVNPDLGGFQGWRIWNLFGIMEFFLLEKPLGNLESQRATSKRFQWLRDVIPVLPGSSSMAGAFPGGNFPGGNFPNIPKPPLAQPLNPPHTHPALPEGSKAAFPSPPTSPFLKSILN